MTHLRIFLRAFLLVTLVACNTRQLAMGHLGGAAMVGFMISLLWWGNSSKDRPQIPGAAIAYGAGGGCGTLLGFYLAKFIGG